MAWEGPQIKIPGLTASANLSAKQFYFVKMSGNKTVDVCSNVADVPVGVLQNAPTSGQEAEVCALGVTKVNADAALAAGNVIGTGADGQAQPVTLGTETTVHVAGVCLEGVSNAGEIATAFVSCPGARAA